MKQIRHYEKGEVDGWMISTIGLVLLVIAAGSLAIWALLNYQEEKTNVDSKIDSAVADARRDQAEKEQKKFLEEEKNPRRDFVGPDDYGRLTFSYPKTWSVYVDSDATGKDYKAYLHPVIVPPVNVKNQQFAMRVEILQQDYAKYLTTYDRQIKEGKLRSTTASINGENAVRLDGNFSDEIRGAAIVFKLRDKTVIIRTDADTFKPDFDTMIQTVSYTN